MYKRQGRERETLFAFLLKFENSEARQLVDWGLLSPGSIKCKLRRGAPGVCEGCQEGEGVGCGEELKYSRTATQPASYFVFCFVVVGWGAVEGQCHNLFFIFLSMKVYPLRER